MEPSGRNQWQTVANAIRFDNGSNGRIGNRQQPVAMVPQRMVRNAMKKGLPRCQAPACHLGAIAEEARFDVVRRFGSQSQASRLPSPRW
jgi:hypothetical protein